MSTLSGLSVYAKQTALSALLPNATNRYVGLLTAMPSASDGTGLVEADTATGYARVAHAAWLNVTSGDDVIRKNSGTITFPVLVGTLTDVVGWAIWDDDGTPTGNLIAFGPMTDAAGEIVVKDFIITDQPRLATQELFVALRQSA